MAEATNENGVVTTSSPGPTPARRMQRCRPAVPLDTAATSVRTDPLGEGLLEAVDHRAERELPRAERLEHQLLLAPVDPGRGEGDLPCQEPGVFSAYSSQREKRSSRPRTTSKKTSWIAFVTGPGSPISWSSTERTGVTSAAVPHMKSSSAT